MRSATSPWTSLSLCALIGCASDPPPPTRDPNLSSTDLIDAAARAGAITELDLAWYRFLAEVAPGLLPEAYRATVITRGPPDVSHYAVLSERLSELDATRRDVFRALTAKPDDAGFLTLSSGRGLGFGSGPPTCESLFASPARVVRAPGGPVDTRHFSFIPIVRSGTPIARDSELRRRVTEALAAPTRNLPGASPATLPFGEYLDAVFEHDRTALGLASPVSDGARVEVHVATCDGELNTARAYRDHIFVSVGLALEEPTFRRIALPHELTHVFQQLPSPRARAARPRCGRGLHRLLARRARDRGSLGRAELRGARLHALRRPVGRDQPRGAHPHRRRSPFEDARRVHHDG